MVSDESEKFLVVELLVALHDVVHVSAERSLKFFDNVDVSGLDLGEVLVVPALAGLHLVQDALDLLG